MNNEILIFLKYRYTQGYISYPRTETTKYPKNFNLQQVLQEHRNSPNWGAHSGLLLESNVSVPTGGVDAGDHPPMYVVFRYF